MDEKYSLEAFNDALKQGGREAALRLALPHAQAGNTDAQCAMALFSRDVEEAKQWLLKATEQDNPVAWNNLGTLYVQLGYRKKAFECYQRAKELGFNCAHPYPPFDLENA
jgi:TPR repeat protein